MNQVLPRLLAATLVVLPLTANAQSYAFVPAKILTKGTNTTAIAGDGEVKVQVLVKKDGSFEVQKVESSTNPADNAAALEVAKTSTYQPATSGGKPADSFYTYVVRFAGSTASGPSTATPSTAGAQSPQALIVAGHYAQAKAQLQAALQANPNDAQANLLLGVADTYLNADADAVAAYEKAGTIPPQYRGIAAQAYEKNATELLNAQKDSDALTVAQKAVELAPDSFSGYYVRGTAESNTGNYAAGQTDLQKAQTLAQSAKADDKTQSVIAYNLMVAQLNAGDTTQAAQTAKDVVRFDSSKQDLVDKALVNGFNSNAQTMVKAGKVDDAVALLESAAKTYPSYAGQLYAQAAAAMTYAKTPDWKRVKSEADKAISSDPTGGFANYLAGLALANSGDLKGAKNYIDKAKTSADYKSDAGFAKQVDTLALNIQKAGN